MGYGFPLALGLYLDATWCCSVWLWCWSRSFFLRTLSFFSFLASVEKCILVQRPSFYCVVINSENRTRTPSLLSFFDCLFYFLHHSRFLALCLYVSASIRHNHSLSLSHSLVLSLYLLVSVRCDVLDPAHLGGVLMYEYLPIAHKMLFLWIVFLLKCPAGGGSVSVRICEMVDAEAWNWIICWWQ